MEYSLSFDENGGLIATFINFEMAMIAAKNFSKLFANTKIILRSTFFSYTYFNGIEI